MITYYSRVPATAVRVEIDGHLYARIPHRLATKNGRIVIAEDYSNPRMVRVVGAKIRNGEAWIKFATVGDAIAPTANLPFAVSAERVDDPSDEGAEHHTFA